MTRAAFQPAGAAPGTDALVARHPVAPALQGWVACYFTVELSRAGELAAVRALPDGCSDILFHFGNPLQGWFSGPRTRPSVYQHRGPTRLLGVQLRPGAAYPLVGRPIRPFADTSCPLQQLGIDWMAAALAPLAAAGNLAGRLALMDRLLIAQFASAAMDPRLLAALDLVIESGGIASVDRLARRAGTSARHLARLFADWIGLTPKQLSRIVRFQQVMDCHATSRPHDWAGLAAELNYADQSHLVRDVAAFAGLTPTALLS
jgi:AraC-like DNA-binding protein